MGQIKDAISLNNFLNPAGEDKGIDSNITLNNIIAKHIQEGQEEEEEEESELLPPVPSLKETIEALEKVQKHCMH